MFPKCTIFQERILGSLPPNAWTLLQRDLKLSKLILLNDFAGLHDLETTGHIRFT